MMKNGNKCSCVQGCGRNREYDINDLDQSTFKVAWCMDTILQSADNIEEQVFKFIPKIV